MRRNIAISQRTPLTGLFRVLLSLVLVCLAGCSPSFLYRHADRLLLWKIDEYVDLTAPQKRLVKERLDALLAKHRVEALPVYEQFLIEVKQKSADGLDREEVGWIFSSYEHLRADLVQRIVEDGGAMLSTITDRQVQYLQYRLHRDQEKAERRAREAPESRLAARASTTLDWLKDWLGALTESQRQRIKELSMALPDKATVWVDYQRDRRHDLIRMLHSTRDPNALSDYLEQWLLFPEKNGSPEYRQALDQMKASVQDMVLAVDRLITPQQRAHALTKLQRLIDEIHSLAAAS